jgi:cell division protein FtsW
MKAIDASGRAFGGLLSAGLTLLIVLTAMINMGTATGTIPTMGQNLPMISTGGTSMVFTALAIGIVLRVSMDKNKNAALD